MNPSDILTESVCSKIKAIAQSKPTQEVCGYISAKGRVVQRPNYAEDPSDDAAWDAPDNAIAIFHSHWKDSHDGWLSPTDIHWAKYRNKPSILYHVGFDAWDLFNPAWHHPFPLRATTDPKSIDHYKGYPWIWSRADCWSIVLYYYRGMLGIDVGDAKRSDDPNEYVQSGWNRYDQELPEHGFVRLDKGTPLQDHDLVVMSITADTPHHIGVITSANDGMILHHFGGRRLSEEETYKPWLQDCTLSRWRYREF